MLKTKCDTCKNKVESYEPHLGYSVPYCNKEHWGVLCEEDFIDEIIECHVWDDCADYTEKDNCE